MAILYPQRLSELVLNDRKLKGEVDTYNALANLPNEFEVFYNRWTASGGSSEAHARPVDFILLHEKLGLLAMEVKGGKIRIGTDGGFEQYHPSKGGWAKIDPLNQVKTALTALVRMCKNDGANYWIPDNVCVTFPHTLRRDITDTPHILPNGTLCMDDLPLFATQIPTLFSKSQNRKWNRDCFLDMRRRLQNMPEASAGAGPQQRRKPRKNRGGPSKSSHPAHTSSRKVESTELKFWQVISAIIIGLAILSAWILYIR